MDAAKQYITATILSLEKYMKEGERGDVANNTGCQINGGYQRERRDELKGEER